MKFCLLCLLALVLLACKPSTDATPTGDLTGNYQFGGSLTITNYQRGYSGSATSYSMVVTGSLLVTTTGSVLRTIYESSTNPEVNASYQVVESSSTSLSLIGTDQFRNATRKIQGSLNRLSDKELVLTRSVIDSSSSSTYVYSKTLVLQAVKN